MKRIQKGFTLIELMIVVAIIGILAAVAIPAYQDYVVKSKLTKVVSTLDPIKTALAMYYQENSGFPNATDSIFPANKGVAVSTGTGPVWNSLGFQIYPTIPEELAALYYSPTNAGASFAINLVMTRIKVNAIDGQTVSVSPTEGTIPASTSTDTFTSNTASVAGSSALLWYYGCLKTNSGANVDPIVKRYFNNTGTNLSC